MGFSRGAQSTEGGERKIETYDISNISGEFMVAGMCVMQDGVIKKNLSRRFKIKTVLTWRNLWLRKRRRA